MIFRSARARGGRRSIRPRLYAACAAYLSPAAVIALWAALIPYLRDGLGLNSLQVGQLVWCFGAGSIAGMLSAAPLTRACGSRLVCLCSYFAAAGCILALALMPRFGLTCLLAAAFALAAGLLEVAANIYGVSLERRFRLRLMTALHAWYSGGELLGAGFMLLALSLNLQPLTAIGCFTALLTVGVILSFPAIENFDFKQERQRSFMRPTLTVAGLCVIVLITYMTGGAMVDWSGIYLADHSPLSLKQAVLGYLAVSLCMMICRIYGNSLVNIFSPFKVAALGALIMGSGLLILFFTPPLWLIVPAFIMIGCGMANITPLAYSAAARQREMPLLPAVSVMSSAGYGGLLAGPALLGTIAHQLSLQAVFGFMALLSLALSLPLIVLLRRCFR